MIDPKHTLPGFEISHLGFSTTRGGFTDTKGTIVLDLAKKAGAVDITIDVNSIQTAVPKLDEHLKKGDFFDVEMFPTITFKSTRVEVNGTDIAIHGDLTMRGVTKPVVLEVSALTPEIKDPGGMTRRGLSARTTVFTVFANVFEAGGLKSGETLLIQGGSSGIGVTAIQMAKALGAKVIVTAGSDDKCDACLKLGADHAINYKTQDFAAEAKNLTGGAGVNVILDMVAGAYVAREVECLAEDGRLVIIAVQGGVKSEFNAGMVLRKRLVITGSTLRPRPVAFKAAIASALKAKVWPLLESGAIKPVIHSTFAAADAAGAGERAARGLGRPGRRRGHRSGNHQDPHRCSRRWCVGVLVLPPARRAVSARHGAPVHRARVPAGTAPAGAPPRPASPPAA